MSYVITDQATIAALRDAYNSRNWTEAYRLAYQAMVETVELPLTDPDSGVGNEDFLYVNNRRMTGAEANNNSARRAA